MKKIIALIFASLFSFLLSAAFASDKASNPSVQTQQGKDGYDIVILIDCSGSMKKTDPRSYRKPAARLFISLLGEYDRVGIIGFGESAKVLATLTENTKKNREGLFGVINKITSKEFSTNITDAVKKGYDELKSSSRKNRILILMSDGKLALGSKEKDEAALVELSRLLTELAKSDIKLYSIAFTEMSDIKLLEDMAKATGGFFKLARVDKDLHVIFASIFEKIKSPDTIPLEDDTFNIDKDINEAILLISKQPGTSTTLIDPAKRKHTPAKYGKNIQWYESKVFDMITIKEPAVGKWKVKLSTKEGNKVFVITNLGLKTSFDKGFVNKGDMIKIDAWLEREGSIITEKDILEQVSFSAEVTTPDTKTTKFDLLDSGKSGDDRQGDGKYSAGFTVNTTGEYSIKIVAEGKTFKREKVLQFKAVEPPPQKVEKKAPAKNDGTKKADWNSVLIKFGIINLVALIVGGIIYFITRLAAKKKGISVKGRE
jgi:Mg-chelatase subunit ChlD